MLVFKVTATVVAEILHRTKTAVLLLLRHAAILLLWHSFLLLRFDKPPIVRLANSTWQVLLLQILGVSSQWIILHCILIMAHDLLFAFESVVAAVKAMGPTILLEFSRFDFPMWVCSFLSSPATATAAAVA